MTTVPCVAYVRSLARASGALRVPITYPIAFTFAAMNCHGVVRWSWIMIEGAVQVGADPRLVEGERLTYEAP